jgi:hypothetical protein
MKRHFVAAVVCLLAGVAIFLIYHAARPAAFSPQEASDSTAQPSSAAARDRNPLPATAGASNSAFHPPAGEKQDLAAQAGQYIAPADPPANLPPETVLQNLRRVIHQYGEMCGGNPVGTNPEITAALSGKNPKLINFLAGQPGMRIDANGELVDSWGTPYFFHQLSGTVMEIHSAGPDKIMWTSDDLVTR